MSSSERHGAVTLGAKRLERGARRRSPGCVQALRDVSPAGVDECEEVAAHAAQVLRRDGEHGARRDRGIDGVAAVAQHVDAGRGRQVIDRAHHAVGCVGGRVRHAGCAHGVHARRVCFWILPVPPLGRSARMVTSRRRLEVGEALAHEGDQARLRSAARRRRHGATRRPRGTSPHRSSGVPTTAASRTAGWVEQCVLDLGAGDVLAAGDDQVLLPVDDPDVAVGSDHGEVAGVEPAVDDDLGRWPRASPR